MRLPTMPAIAGLFAMVLLAGCSDGGDGGTAAATAAGRQDAAPRKAETAAVPRGAGFDFYVLSLSWSPSWCAENDRGGSTDQCRRGAEHGFIVHGLWPQFDTGHPEFCRTRQPDRVPEALGRRYLDIIPSMGLIGHQWRKHGTCSGLSQADYFRVTRAARERLVVPRALDDGAAAVRRDPAEVEDLLVNANPGLTPRGIAVTCDGGRLEEIRVCLTPGLAFRDCPEVDRAACRAGSVSQPAIQ
ncbi:ribonuclease T(2) [Rhizobium sp. TRM95111]|uniref:ribonuclease T2 family protein n=1 Tax=Rhizobium alarense TaxID=2846851 RepID=UPI001F18F9DF|nr:ribonuclease T(2) [Rhizobium alarense]MCF3641529.1 ribonuclease T(2) [Rhizobium alarense]